MNKLLTKQTHEMLVLVANTQSHTNLYCSHKRNQSGKHGTIRESNHALGVPKAYYA